MRSGFVYDAVRTPFGKYGGGLAGVRPDDLAPHVMRAIVDRSPGLDLSLLDEVVLGNANGAGAENRNVARMAALLAGLPVTIPGRTVNPCDLPGASYFDHATSFAMTWSRVRFDIVLAPAAVAREEG